MTITGSDLLETYLIENSVADGDDEPIDALEIDEDEAHEIEQILEAEEAAYRAARQKRAREELPLVLMDIARVPSLMRKQGN
jgi:hypothetical protein